MRLVSSLACALLVSGCVGSQQQAAAPPQASTPGSVNTPYTLTDADRAAIEAGVRASLNNPPSAAFRTMLATINADGTVTACGYVNVGGAGDKPYIGALTSAGFVMSAMGGTDSETIAVQKSCGQRGVHI